MKKRNLSSKIIFISIISAAILAFAYHIRYAEEPVSMDELVRTSIVAPAAAGQDIKLAIRKAATHNVSYIKQILLYKQYKNTDFYRITKNRIWDGLAAVLVVFMIFRIGSMCSSKLTGIISAFIFALIPPAIWNNHALQILIVLIHFELLVFAFKKNVFWFWITWALASIFLFSNGIYAEPILLQFWFIALFAGTILWLLLSNFLPKTKSKIKSRRHSHGRSNIWKKISEDSGLSKFVIMMFSLIITIFVFSVVASSFVPFFVNPLMLLISTGSMCTIVFMLPNFTRERHILIKWYKKRQNFNVIFCPEETFTSLTGSNQLFNMCFAYSGAILAFLPFLYFCHKEINIFINNWEPGNLISFVSETENPINWLLLFMPVIFLVVNYVGYFLKSFSKERLIGASIVFLLSSVYIFQQRYAVLSTPFYVICIAGFVSSIIELPLKLFKVERFLYQNEK